jgi:hypothetical protein
MQSQETYFTLSVVITLVLLQTSSYFLIIDKLLIKRKNTNKYRVKAFISHSKEYQALGIIKH